MIGELLARIRASLIPRDPESEEEIFFLGQSQEVSLPCLIYRFFRPRFSPFDAHTHTHTHTQTQIFSVPCHEDVWVQSSRRSQQLSS